MELDFVQLIELIQQEIFIYKRLLRFSLNKKNAILQQNLAEMLEISSREDELIEQSLVLIKQRTDLTAGKTLAVILDILSEDQAEKLFPLIKKMDELAKEITEQNNLNQVLIQNAREVSDFTVNLLANNNQGIYDKKSKYKQQQQRSIINKRA